MVDYWGPSKRLLGDMKFLQSLAEYDKDNIPPDRIKKIREEYTTDPEFVPEKVKSASSACEGLCKWVRAMEAYDRVARVVAPKKVKLGEAEGQLATAMAALKTKQDQLRSVQSKLEALKREFQEMTSRKETLQKQVWVRP